MYIQALCIYVYTQKYICNRLRELPWNPIAPRRADCNLNVGIVV